MKPTRQRTKKRKEERAQEKAQTLQGRLIFAAIATIIGLGFLVFLSISNTPATSDGQGPHVTFSGSACERQPRVCRNFVPDFRSIVPQELWDVEITVTLQNIQAEAQTTWDETGMTFLSFRASLHPLSVEETTTIAGHEFYHVTAGGQNPVTTNLGLFNPETNTRDLIYWSSGFAVYGFTGIENQDFEEGAAYLATGYAPDTEFYQWPRDYMAELVELAGWTNNDLWMRHADYDVFVQLCTDAYSTLTGGEICDTAVMETLLWRMPQYMTEQDIAPSDLSLYWEQLSHETRVWLFEGNSIPIQWDLRQE